MQAPKLAPKKVPITSFEPPAPADAISINLTFLDGMSGGKFATFTGTTIKIDHNPHSSVLELKKQIQIRKGHAPEFQEIMFNGQKLEDAQVLSACGIGQASTVHVLFMGQ